MKRNMKTKQYCFILIVTQIKSILKSFTLYTQKYSKFIKIVLFKYEDSLKSSWPDHVY